MRIPNKVIKGGIIVGVLAGGMAFGSERNPPDLEYPNPTVTIQGMAAAALRGSIIQEISGSSAPSQFFVEVIKALPESDRYLRISENATSEINGLADPADVTDVYIEVVASPDLDAQAISSIGFVAIPNKYWKSWDGNASDTQDGNSLATPDEFNQILTEGLEAINGEPDAALLGYTSS